MAVGEVLLSIKKDLKFLLLLINRISSDFTKKKQILRMFHYESWADW